ncbi:MAG TPA: hypothetical protein VK074_03095 [Fodinibius sp.]|nr:hypothetical protein [Fodinibius sp.]
MKQSPLLFYPLMIIISILLLTSISYAQAKKISELKVRSDDDVSASYLTDGEGMSLYIFLKDSTGSSTCADECADAWPPVLLDEGDLTVGEGVDSTMIGTIDRPGETLKNPGEVVQLTYNGWPLYYYADDRRPGDKTGQDIEDYGAEWYLITSDGEKVEMENP